MKTITYAKIDKSSLSFIIFAARWQMKEWDKLNKLRNIDSAYKEAIEATIYLEHFIREYPGENYYIRSQNENDMF